MPHGVPPQPTAQSQQYGLGVVRNREWEKVDSRQQIYERDSKRMRPFPSNPNDGGYPNQPQPPYNRSAAEAVNAPNANMGTPVAYNPQRHPGMLPHNPPIHPPNPQALTLQQRQGPFPHGTVINPQHRPPLPQQHQQMQAPYNSQYIGPHGQPGSAQTSYDRLPPPPRKDVRPSAPESSPTGARTIDGHGVAGGQSTIGPEKGTADQPMSFKDFLLKQPDNISSHAAQEAYDEYVQTFTARKPNEFFEKHKGEEWFRERYDPEYVSKRILRIREEVQERAKVHRYLWDRGGSQVCAPELSAFPEGTNYSKDIESAADGAGQANEAPTKSKEDQSAKSEEEIETKTAVGNEPIKKEENENESKEQGQASTALDAKEIATETTMTKHEENEAPKDEVKTEKLEALLIEDKTKDPTQSSTARDSRQGESAILQSSQSEEGHPLVLPLRREHQKDTIFMRSIPTNLCRDDLTEVLKYGGDGTLNLSLRRLKLGDINPLRSLERFGWAVYDCEETAAKAIAAVKGVKVISKKQKSRLGDEAGTAEGNTQTSPKEDPQSTYVIDCMLNLERKKKFSQGRVLPAAFGTPERMKFDVEQSVKMMRCLDADRKMDSNLNPLTDELVDSLDNDGQRLDHVVTYLREVHYFCYYSGNEFLEDPTSMPPQELRPKADRGRHMSEADNRLLRRVDERARWVLERDYDRPRSNSDNGEGAKEEALKKWFKANTKYEAEGRYRCCLPPHKLFKGPEFVEKHIRTRHADKVKQIADKALMDTYRANFESDASKDEVVKIYNEGVTGNHEHDKQIPGKPGMNVGRSNVMGNGYGQTGATMNVGMYNPYMVGMQFPLMMPTAAGYTGGYAGTPGYSNVMAFPGRGMQAPGVGRPGMPPGGVMPTVRNPNEGNMAMHHRPPPRRDVGRGGLRGRRGGPRRGIGDYYRGGHSDGRPADPRARGSRRVYNDLDAPSNGPSFDLVRYEDV